MKYQFSQASSQKLATCDERLQRVTTRALGYGVMDFTVVVGRRDQTDQDRLFAEGKSKLRWPESRHNATPSEALDIAPFVGGRISWDPTHCCVLAGLMLAAAQVEGVPLRWGGNWDRDGEPVTDQAFDDLVHFELDR